MPESDYSCLSSQLLRWSYSLVTARAPTALHGWQLLLRHTAAGCESSFSSPYAREIREPWHRRQMLWWSPVVSSPPHSCQVLCDCAQKPSTSPVLLFQQWRCWSPTTLLLLNEVTQNRTTINDVTCLPKILSPLGIRSSVSVTLQTLRCREMTRSPDSGPAGFSEDGSSAPTVVAPTDGPTLNARMLQISVSVWWDWWFQHRIQQHGKMLFPSLHSCTAKLLYSNCQAFNTGWLHFKNK